MPLLMSIRGAFCLLPTLLQALALAERSQSMVLIEPRTLPLSQITCDLMHAWQGAWTEATVLRLVQAETFLRQQGVQRAATDGLAGAEWYIDPVEEPGK